MDIGLYFGLSSARVACFWWNGPPSFGYGALDTSVTIVNHLRQAENIESYK